MSQVVHDAGKQVRRMPMYVARERHKLESLHAKMGAHHFHPEAQDADWDDAAQDRQEPPIEFCRSESRFQRTHNKTPNPKLNHGCRTSGAIVLLGRFVMSSTVRRKRTANQLVMKLPFVKIQAIQKPREAVVTQEARKSCDRPLVAVEIRSQWKQRRQQLRALRGRRAELIP